VIFDQSTRRARLVDFETVHAATSSPDDRHAEDITVFLLDLLGSVGEENLLAMAAAFLAGYNRPAIWALAKSRLVIPAGFGRLWWGIRTEYAPIGTCVDASPCCAKAWTLDWPPSTSADLRPSYRRLNLLNAKIPTKNHKLAAD
jgi:hypothetical protein